MHQQAFDSAASRQAMSEQTCRKHSGVVEDEQIAPLKVLGYLRERGVLDFVRMPSKHQQP